MHILRTSLAAAASALVALGLVVTPAATTAAQATTAPTTTTRTAHPTSSDAGKTTVEIVPADRGVLTPGQELSLSVTVTNDTDTDLPAGTAEFDVYRQYAGTRDVLSDWLADTSTTGYLGAPMDSVDVPAVPAHRSVTLDDVRIASGNVGLGGYTSFGARRIAADYRAGSTSAVDRSAITWYPDFEQTPVGVSVAMPITMPADADGLISAKDLASATSLDGTLTQQLDAAQDHNVALGIDPRIIASIRILGENAPSSATTWLERLERMRNETFALSYADADVTGLHQAGSSGILAPISLDQQVDPKDFPGAATPTPTPSATPGGTSTPTPSSTPTSGATDDPAAAQSDATPTLPTTQSLLDFPYSMSSVSWPVEDTVATGDLEALHDAGTTATIVASGNTSAGPDTTVSASEKIGDDQVLVSDTGMSALLRAAATATTQHAWSDAMSKLTATLATAARQGGTSGPVLLTLGRDWPTDSLRLSQALDALESTAWASPADLTTAAATTPGSLSLTSEPNSDARLDQLERLVQAERNTTDFASAIATPADLTAPMRLSVLAAASNAFRSDDTAFVKAVDTQVKQSAKTVSSIGILDGSSITLLGDRSSLPISIRNRSAFPVTVYLTVQPSNSFLRIEKNAVKVTVQSDSSSRVTFPVQSVANGKVELTMSLTSATGVRIADPATVEINVQAQWETFITGAAAIAVIAIFGLGIYRNVRRRLRRRRGEPDDEDDDDPNRLLAVQPDAPGQPATVTTGPGGTASGSASAAAVPVVGSRLDTASAHAAAEPSLATGTRADDVVPAPDLEDSLISTTQQQPDVDAEPVADRNLGRASAMLAAGTMVSRVLGFAKTFVLAYAIGQNASPSANAFAVANQLPNNIYALIAGGLLSAVLIPQIVRAMQKNTDGGQAYVNKIVTLGGSAFIVITIAATALAPLLVRFYTSDTLGSDGAASDLAVAFAFWCLPQILFYAMYSLLGEVLNAKQVFGPFTWAPLLNNVIAIAGLVVFIAMFGHGHSTPGEWTPLKIAVLAGSASVGVFAQAAFLPLFWRRAGLTFRPDFRWRGVGLKSTGTAAGWLFAMILVTQGAGVVQSQVAWLGQDAGPGNAVLGNAWLIFMLPHSIITVSIATAYFTRMSHDAERGDLAAVRRNLSTSLRIVGLFTVFASVALMVVAVPFGRLYEGTFESSLQVGAVLVAYMPGLVLFSMLFVIQRVFWAMHDHRTPFLMQLVQSVLFVIGALAVTTFPASVIGIGVAACTTIAGSAQTIVALVVVRRRLGSIDGSAVTRSHAQFVIAALMAGVAGLLTVNFFGAFSEDGFAMSDRTGALITIVLTGAVMTGVYALALVVAKNGEVRGAVDMVKARLGR
ncbi:DUF6049 family protein [Curtobacterium sp. 9128]|uniref:DUF6049 family protein n=1 Tax=Curtobacterium sp. 9128 TaxID=1793722 RepID=UPI001C92F0B2|nr:DUF6049 family protein [Curtobacterium sp. 9128]